jgi:uncharacterized phiE125 gp8 family phage protein
MGVEEMRALLGLGPEIPDEEVVNRYVLHLEGEPETPSVPLIALDAVKKHLKVEHSDEDDLIQGYLDASIDALNGPEGWLGRTLRPSIVTARIDNFDDGTIRLPLPPVKSIIAVEVMDTPGKWSVVDDATWSFEDGSMDVISRGGWPRPCVSSRGIRVLYKAGYDVLPAPIRAAVLLMVGDLYMNRETTVPSSNASKVPMSTTVQNLLRGFQVYQV